MKRMIAVLLLLMLTVSLCACSDEGSQLYQKYASIIDMLEAENYNGAIHEISQMAMAEQMQGQEKTPVVEILATTWITKAEKGPKEITFSADGSLTVDGKAMTWTTDKGEMDYYMDLQIFEDGQHKYVAYFRGGSDYAVPYINLYYMEVRDGEIRQGDQIGSYYNHPMIPYLMNSWYAVTDYEKITDSSLWLNSDGDTSINGDSYAWEITDSSKKDQLTLHASAKNEATGEYTMTVYYRGETPMMTLTNDLTGETGTYYNGGFDRDYEWVELVYAEAISDLEHFKQYGNIYQNDMNYYDVPAIENLHERFSACAGYRDTDAILADWNAVYFANANYYLNYYQEYGYVNAGETHDDGYGRESALEYLQGLFLEIADYPESAAILADWDQLLLDRANYYLNYYLENNRVYLNDRSLYNDEALAYLYNLFTAIEGNEEAAATAAKFTILPQMYTSSTTKTIDNLGNESNGTWEVFKYNALGQMIFADYADEMAETYYETSDLNFYYDADGKISQVKYAYNPETSVNAVMTPTYDENGNMVSLTAVYNSATYVYTFTYDEAGNRITGVLDQNTNGGTDSWYIKTFNYTYDDQGRLIEKVEHRRTYYKYTTTYTYDANGYLSQETMVYEYNGAYQYFQTITYTNDANGRPITADVTTDNTSDSYQSKVITYHYTDLYFYNAEG